VKSSELQAWVEFLSSLRAGRVGRAADNSSILSR
jgi:hypothetical protein